MFDEEESTLQFVNTYYNIKRVHQQNTEKLRNYVMEGSNEVGWSDWFEMNII